MPKTVSPSEFSDELEKIAQDFVREGLMLFPEQILSTKYKAFREFTRPQFSRIIAGIIIRSYKENNFQWGDSEVQTYCTKDLILRNLENLRFESNEEYVLKALEEMEEFGYIEIFEVTFHDHLDTTAVVALPKFVKEACSRFF